MSTDTPSYSICRTIGRAANDSIASLRRYQKMNYAADNALRFSKKSQADIIVCRHVAGTQRNSLPLWRFRTVAALPNCYNRHKVTGCFQELIRRAT
jgi:hypothetical protein